MKSNWGAEALLLITKKELRFTHSPYSLMLVVPHYRFTVDTERFYAGLLALGSPHYLSFPVQDQWMAQP
jgi:hypothetical protein